MTIHADDCDCDTYGCVLRRKGVQVHAAAMPNRHNRRSSKKSPPNYNKQIMGEERPGGGFMPYLNADMTPIRRKQMESQRNALMDVRNGQRHREREQQALATTEK